MNVAFITEWYIHVVDTSINKVIHSCNIDSGRDYCSAIGADFQTWLAECTKTVFSNFNVRKFAHTTEYAMSQNRA